MRTKTIAGSPNYVAPEVVMQEDEYDSTIDWWSYGCVLYFMLFGKCPYQMGDRTPSKIKSDRNIIYTELKFPEDIKVDEDAKDLIKKLLTLNPHERLGSNDDANDIKNHKFFDGINWDEYIQKKIEPKIKTELNGPLDLKYFPGDLTVLDVADFNKFLKNEYGEYEYDEMKGFSFVSNSLIPLKENILKDKDE